jgi:uncharacterized protein
VAEKKKVPLKEGLWTEAKDKKPTLIGSKCQKCGEIYFPKKPKGLCINCRATDMKDVELSREGKIFTFSKVMIPPAGGFYHGNLPYAYGYVELPEGVRVQTLFPDADLDNLKVGKKVSLLIDRLCDDAEGNEVVTYKFGLAKVQK